MTASNGTVLVLGGTGHVGAHLLPLLLSRGYRVRALVRPGSQAGPARDIEWVTGALTDVDSLRQAMRGCASVIHMAAPTTLVAGLRAAVATGTRNVFDAATREGVQRLVYTSSIATVGYSPRADRVLSEVDRAPCHASAYHEAKWDAEEIALEHARAGRVETIIVNPSTTIGPLDLRTTPSTMPLLKAMTRPHGAWFESGLTLAHVASVAEGHVGALEQGRNGERYILGGERMTIRDYFTLINRVNGFGPPRLRVPTAVMLTAGLGFSALQGIGVSQVPFDFRRARTLLGRYGYYSSDKAIRELGYAPRPAESAIREYVEWKRSLA